jgi:hypothetical protein
MLNRKILEYVDEVILKISASKEFKMKLENELIRHIMVASENTSIDEVINKLGSPKGLADRMSRKLIPEISKELNKIFIEFNEQNVKRTKVQDRSSQELAATENYDTNHHNNHHSNHHSNHHRLQGEYMREESNVNIKLLYIPLIQICSGIERVRLPYVDERFFE